jgi:hypothetical protein
VYEILDELKRVMQNFIHAQLLYHSQCFQIWSQVMYNVKTNSNVLQREATVHNMKQEPQLSTANIRGHGTDQQHYHSDDSGSEDDDAVPYEMDNSPIGRSPTVNRKTSNSPAMNVRPGSSNGRPTSSAGRPGTANRPASQMRQVR